MTRPRGGSGGRHGGTLRRQRRPPTMIPDLLITLATAGMMMAAVFYAASFFSSDVTAESAGPVLARLFASTLVIASIFTFLLAYVLLRDERHQGEHFVFPVGLGIVIGGIDASLFLVRADGFLFAPFLLAIFAVGPVRRLARSLVPGKARR